MVSVLFAPDKFKGSLSADEVARALERGLLAGAPHTRVDRLALADGGEGSVAAACAGGLFSPEKITVGGPTGQPVTACVAVHDRTVLIEAAAVCGLGILPGGSKAPVRSPLRKADDTELDWVVVRENSEGEYAGLGGRNLSARGQGGEVAVQSALFTEVGCERIMRFAFDLARTRTRRKVSSVTKSNAQQYGMVLWDDVFKRVALDYPDVETESVLVDAMSAKFVLKPEDLSVVVASNLNADILSDLGSALAGSLGLAASANLNPERPFPSMFEPVHGSAPDIAGQGLANPIGAVGSAALMLDHFGLPDQAARLEKAIEATTAAGILTRDVGGTASTEDVTKALVDALTA
ncbi:isocitrate/isopropylmalate family dehydrogenase [Streptomyces sp. cg40]|uniref:isocitrate/isopropylmalate dehydrogenase family protein n=1 Tax=Streptomyces sp. cg40 TaxID=3419764 RepID=UPI003D02EAC8